MVGEFKDDCLQQITGTLQFGIAGVNSFGALTGSGATGVFGGVSKKTMTFAPSSSPQSAESWDGVQFDASRVARTGTVTHGKQKGVKIIIKVL